MAGWPGGRPAGRGGGWLDKLEIRLNSAQLQLQLKSKLELSLAIKLYLLHQTLSSINKVKLPSVSTRRTHKQENMDPKDCPLGLKQFDHLEAYSAPRFFNVLKRPSGEESLSLEDLDGLQIELEALLSNVVVRKKHINKELDILNNLDKSETPPFEELTQRLVQGPM